MNPLITWLRQSFIKTIRNKSIVQHYKKNTAKQYFGWYWKQWIAGIMVLITPLTAHCVLPCDSYTVTGGTSFRGKVYSNCNCLDVNLREVSHYINYILDGEGRGTLTVKICADESDSVCVDSGVTDIPNENSTLYFKHASSDNDFYKCDWTKDVGYSNAQKYVPSSPVSSSSPTASPPQPVNASILSSNWVISGLLGLLIFLGVIGLYRHQSK